MKLLTAKEVELVNELATLELSASQAYLHLSICMMSQGFFGAQKFFESESDSEREHFKKWSKFMNDLGYEIEVRKLDEESAEHDGLEAALDAALEMEMDLLKKYEDACSEDISMKLKIKLYEFVTIQTEAVGEYADLLARLERTNEPILIDQELGK